MRILTVLAALAILISPAAASDSGGFVVGAGYTSIFTAQEYVGNQAGIQLWASRELQPDLLVRVDFTRAGLGQRYTGVVPRGGFIWPGDPQVTEPIVQEGSLSMFDLTLSGTHALSRRLSFELGAGLGLTWLRTHWHGDSTGTGSIGRATRPHALALVGISARPMGAWPVGLQVRFVIRRVAEDLNQAYDGFDPFGSAFNVSDLKASLFWQI